MLPLWFPPLVSSSDVGVSDTLDQNRSGGINLSRPLNCLGLSVRVITDSGRTTPPNGVIAFLLSPLNEKLTAHNQLLLSNLCAVYVLFDLNFGAGWEDCLTLDNFESRIHTPGGGPARLRLRKNLSPPGKRRFAIAHELGHLKLRHDPGQPSECAEREFLAWYNDQGDKEAEANVFAAELIMPESLFAPRVTGAIPSFEVIESLASDFQTTLTATAIRYVQLCGQKCAIVCSTNSRVTWCWPSPDFHYWMNRGTELRPHCYAIDFFCKGPDAPEMREMQEVPRDAWIDGESMSDSIREQSRALSSYGSVITLLWVYY